MGKDKIYAGKFHLNFLEERTFSLFWENFLIRWEEGKIEEKIESKDVRYNFVECWFPAFEYYLFEKVLLMAEESPSGKTWDKLGFENMQLGNPEEFYLVRACLPSCCTHREETEDLDKTLKVKNS